MSELRVKINNKLVDIDDLKVTELKAELKKRGVSTAGRKEELQEKLKNVSHGLNFAQVCSIFSWLFVVVSVRLMKYLLQHSSSGQVEAASESLNLNDTGLSQNISNIDLSLNADGMAFC